MSFFRVLFSHLNRLVHKFVAKLEDPHGATYIGFCRFYGALALKKNIEFRSYSFSIFCFHIRLLISKWKISKIRTCNKSKYKNIIFKGDVLPRRISYKYIKVCQRSIKGCVCSNGNVWELKLIYLKWPYSINPSHINPTRIPPVF